MWKEHRDAACHYMVTWSKLNWSCSWPELGGTIKRGGFIYINGKMQCRNNIGLLEDGDGHFTNVGRDKTEMLNSSPLFSTPMLDQTGSSALS